MGLSFSSLEFFVFFTVCGVVLAGTRKTEAQKWLLIAFSCLFYVSFGLAGVIVVILMAGADFYVCLRLASSISGERRKRWLWAGIAANVGLLALFKYSAFLSDSAAGMLRFFGLHFWVPGYLDLHILGLSYFTFSGMSYILDVYYGNIEPSRSISEFLSYLVYFPKLIAGPIVRAADFLPQLRSGVQFSAENFEIGCAYFLLGAVKKLVIADQLAPHVSMIFAAPQQYNAATLVQGMIGYTVQIYADFSGYSDMAIGCARIMGLKFPQNFLMPYSSVNIAEFWRRWHITMSSWFRDYLFLPLEMGSRQMRNANMRVARNMVLTMLLCGLWHGAGWNFVLWGGLHGVALTMYLVYANKKPGQERKGARWSADPRLLGSRALTLSVVMIGWILFGTATLRTAFVYLWRMLTWASDGVALGSPYILPLAALVLVAHVLINKDRNLVEELSTYSVLVRAVTYACLLLAVTSLVPSESVPFVYVHF